MIILDDKTKKIEVKLGGSVATNELPLVCNWIDQTQYGASENDLTTNGGTAVTLCPAPNQGDRPTRRAIKFVSIQNKDTVSQTITVQLNNNSTIRKIAEFILSSGDNLFYEDNKGWYILDKYGNTKIISIVINQGDMIYLQASGTDTYTATSASISAYMEGLSFAVKFANANTGASSLNINGLGAKSLKIFGTDNTGVNADGFSDIKSGQILDVTYDGTYFQIKSVTDRISMSV